MPGYTVPSVSAKISIGSGRIGHVVIPSAQDAPGLFSDPGLFIHEALAMRDQQFSLPCGQVEPLHPVIHPLRRGGFGKFRRHPEKL